MLSCRNQEVPAHYLIQHWKPGTMQRYSLIIADSGFVHIENSVDKDSLVSSDRGTFLVELTVLDTANGPMIEWKQFFPRLDPTSMDTIYDQLTDKVLYRCDLFGRFSAIINKNEIKRNFDSLVRTTWRANGWDTSLAESLIAGSDAQSLAQQFSPLLVRFHGLYGAELLAGDTMFGMAQDLDSAVMRSRFNYVLSDVRVHCGSGMIALRSWVTSSDTMDLMKEVVMLPQTTNDQAWGNMQNEIELCLDTMTWFPQRYLFRRTSLAGGTKVVRTMAMNRL